MMSAAKQYLRKAFPDHWSFLLGEIALYSLLILVITGIFLTFWFHPDMSERPYDGSYVPLQGVQVSEAYSSVLHISFDIRGGLLMRQVHHWAALVFVASIGIHMLRIFFTGAFRRPREINWMIGVTLFLLALLEGFCGYSLPDDLLSGTGLRTAEGIVLSIPVIGTYLSFFIFGGEYPGHEIIPRMYSFHILLVPGAILALVGAHLALVVYLKHTQWAQPGKTNRNVIGKPVFPAYAAKSMGLFFTLCGVLVAMSALFQINPVWVYGPYRPDQVSTDAQPDWYIGFLEGALRLMPQAETRVAGHTVAWAPFIAGAVLPAVLVVILYVYPWFERWITGGTEERHLLDRPRNQPTRTALGAAAVFAYGVLVMAGGQDVLSYVFRWPVEWLTYFFRSAFIIGTVLVYLITKRACLGLQAADRHRIRRGDAGGEIRRSADGYERARVVLPGQERYRLLARFAPDPLKHGTEPSRLLHRHRVRNTLSAWYFRDRVDLPATPAQRRTVSTVLTAPDEEEPGE
ncbi:ubiquinol-cytochrome c reductase cytochrome b subunit [Streptomyces bomunensis]|uniref:Cytochrome bc1 complex cytochrome b subunit n=2 Tax=Streptomyces montanisoli TaxID=2798581 RepID=A0A940MB87_9ACTN|nr:ubiquinol-cytochrome c reductase cytochrome b subunit [Streptomyces montanisoli]MBP0456845.1 ubiquinol-cytochrome c reductase cytochrome b subunit [Streptomyces montanisoli]